MRTTGGWLIYSIIKPRRDGSFVYVSYYHIKYLQLKQVRFDVSLLTREIRRPDNIVRALTFFFFVAGPRDRYDKRLITVSEYRQINADGVIREYFCENRRYF